MSAEAENSRSLRSGSGKPGVTCKSFCLACAVLPPTFVQEIMAPICELEGTSFHSRSVLSPCFFGGFASEGLKIALFGRHIIPLLNLDKRPGNNFELRTY